MLEPTSSVLVCGTPRCGSSFFCDLLTSTAVAGRPLEYFWCENVHRDREAWGVASDREYLARTLELGTTPNGVFGVKIMWNYFLGDFLLWLRRCLPELASLEDLTLIETVFPQPRFISITRGDVVGQAVSLV
jgi:LPS sulfotransferase NodH